MEAKKMTFEQLIQIISAGAGFLLFLIGFIIALVKAVKEKNLEKVQNILTSAAKEAVTYAEKIPGISGETKKTIAMTKMNQTFIDNNVQYDESAASDAIEDVIALSKQVNAKDTSVADSSAVSTVESEEETESESEDLKLLKLKKLLND